MGPADGGPVSDVGGVDVGVTEVVGRHRLPSDVAGELVRVLADDPPIVVCDLGGLASAGPAVITMFAPVAEYLTRWPGTVVVVVAGDAALRERLSVDAPRGLLVSASEASGVAEARAMLPRVRRGALRLAPLAASVREGRVFTVQTLSHWGLSGLVDPAVVVVDELVTNSMLHVGSVVELALSEVPGWVRVAVRDRGGGLPRQRTRGTSTQDIGGWGLHLVDELSAGWGVLPDRHGGKTVWAVLGAPPVPRPGAGPAQQRRAWSRVSPRTPLTYPVPSHGDGEEAASLLPGDWSSLIALLDGQPDADPMTRAQRLCELCVQVGGVSGVAMGIGTNGRSTVCASDELSNRLEDLQTTVSEGPSIEAFKKGWPVLAPDLAAPDETRWPLFRPVAVEAGARAMFAFPLRVAAIGVGALTLYRRTHGGLHAGQLQDARTLAEAASILLTLDQPGEHTAEAFLWAVGDRSRFRGEVYQAVGATMVQLGVDARDAYARICAHAYAQGRTIGDVADDIIARRLRLQPG